MPATTPQLTGTSLLAAGRRLRIAQVAPLYERVPPVRYGGTERIVAYLCDGLAERGHAVTLFASGGIRGELPGELSVPHRLPESQRR